MPNILQYQPRTQVHEGGVVPQARALTASPNPLAGLGDAFAAMAENAQKRQDEQARAWAIDAVSQARLEWTAHLQDAQANAPLGAEGFTQKFVTDFDAYSKNALKAAPNETAAKYFHERLADIRTSLGEKAITFEAGARVDYRDTKFNAAIDNAQKTVAMDPSQFDVVLGETLAVIDASALPPKARADMRQKAVEGIASSVIWSEIRRSPTAFLEKIGLAAGAPQLKNKDGSISTESTITVQIDDKWVVLPTIVDGKRVDEIEAVALWKEGKNPDVGEFSTQLEADEHAQLRSATGGGIGKTGIKAFDILTFEKRTRFIADAITLSNQINTEAERAATRERKQHGDDMMKEALSRLDPQKGQAPLTREFIEQARPFIEPAEYKSLLKALKDGGIDGEGGGGSDPVAFREVQATLYNDPEAAARQALAHHRGGRLSNSDLSSVLTKSRELQRSEGPKSEYERSRQRIVGNLDPGPFVQDPVGRGRMAEALYEFDTWIESGKRTDDEIRKRGEEITKRYQLWDKSKLMPQPAPVKSSDAKTPREKALAPIGQKWDKAKKDLAAKRISKDQYNKIASDLKAEWASIEQQYQDKDE